MPRLTLASLLLAALVLGGLAVSPRLNAAETVVYTSAPLLETDQPGERFCVYLRDTDDAGLPLVGTDRVHVNYKVRITGDNGTTRYRYVERRLAAVPTGIWSNAQKLELWQMVKDGHAAARSVATGD